MFFLSLRIMALTLFLLLQYSMYLLPSFNSIYLVHRRSLRRINFLVFAFMGIFPFLLLLQAKVFVSIYVFSSSSIVSLIMSHCVSTLVLFNLAFQPVADRSFLIESKSALSYCFMIFLYWFSVNLQIIWNCITQWSLLPRGLWYSI